MQYDTHRIEVKNELPQFYRDDLPPLDAI